MVPNGQNHGVPGTWCYTSLAAFGENPRTLHERVAKRRFARVQAGEFSALIR